MNAIRPAMHTKERYGPRLDAGEEKEFNPVLNTARDSRHRILAAVVQ
jgi:hypothetical protein